MASDHQNASGDGIAQHREAIDGIDREIVRLVSERAAHAQAIGHLKGGGIVYRPEREAQVLAQVAASNPGPLAADALKRVFVEVMSACRALEQTIRVAYLGPAGTFSELAVGQHFGQSVESEPCPSIDAVFRAVESEGVQYAVVPVENSTEGMIGRTLDLLLTTPAVVCGEVVVRVHQNLMVKAGGLEGIVKVYSHAQSLAQCHGWLNANLPRAERIAVSSNAEAARIAAGEPGAAAIGPSIAADRYGLVILAPKIEDDARNRTRFLVLGRQDTAPSGRDRTSLVMSAPNRPGAVHALIAPFAARGVSMTRIESRPARTGQWDYLFYIDIEGHVQDAAVEQALGELRKLAPYLKILGSYPTAAI